ncbi:hypothetical protein CSH63_32025 [Micromonospora tulbaghiae]|uniref:Uncharacterized protein n=1 Tax=Micromonospora tulbaghiae TaxID=479978 RepID=A0A386WVH5_9ACTN|nr:hypothetical protein CSH63_32025 [Micromonospora tulbaghiae]
MRLAAVGVRFVAVNCMIDAGGRVAVRVRGHFEVGESASLSLCGWSVRFGGGGRHSDGGIAGGWVAL